MDTVKTKKKKEAFGNGEAIAAIDQAIEALPTDMQITMALRYGEGPQELRRVITDARTRLEAIKNTLQPNSNSEGKET